MIENIKRSLVIIFLLTVISRLFAIYFFGDTVLTNEWRIIIFNLENEGVFGSRYVDGKVVPNIFMPPLYAFFLAFVNYFVNDMENLIKSILFIQLIFSTFSVFIIYKILESFFSKKTCIISSFIFSLFPLNVYSVGQISSITLQVFLLSIFFYFFVKVNFSKKIIYFIGFSIVSSGLILLRAEFVLFFIFSLIFIYFAQKNLKSILISIILTLIIISPYIIRNYVIFDKIVITQSFGYNLWKGNNENLKVDGYYLQPNPRLAQKINNIGFDAKYDLLIDKIYQDEAVKFIINNPAEVIKLYFKKIYSFMFIDLNSSYPGYYNYAHIIPKIIISITTLLGIYFGLRNRIFNYFSSYFLLNILAVSVFFILPRYSLALLPCQIIISSIYFEKILKK